MATLKQSIVRAGLVALGLTLGASNLHADTIRYADRTKNPVENVTVIADTLWRIEWQANEGNKAKSDAQMWDIGSIEFSRRSRQVEFEERINTYIRLARTRTWVRAIDKIDDMIRDLDPKAKAPRPDNYPETPEIVVRMHAIKVMAIANLGRDGLESALSDYWAANLAYANKIAKDFPVYASGESVKDGPLKGARYKALHSSTVDVYQTLADLYMRNKDVENAWLAGYSQLVDVSEQMRRATNSTEFLARYALGALETSAIAFQSLDEPDWKRASEIHTRIQTIAGQLSNSTRAKQAMMDNARCRVELGDYLNATTIFSNEVRSFEDSRKDARGPQSGEWLTTAKASVYSSAYNGLGLIAMKQSKWADAVEHFSNSLTLFSANAEARGEALLNCGLANVELAKKYNKKAEYYQNLAESYLQELVDVLPSTAALARAGELRNAIAALTTAK